jgi:hypothetical protein
MSSPTLSPPSSASAAAPSSSSSAGAKPGKNKPYVALWDLDSHGVDLWLNSISDMFQPGENEKDVISKASAQDKCACVQK